MGPKEEPVGMCAVEATLFMGEQAYKAEMVLGWRITLMAGANEKIMRAIWGWLTGKLWLVGV
jgi:hypothetical protein